MKKIITLAHYNAIAGTLLTLITFIAFCLLRLMPTAAAYLYIGSWIRYAAVSVLIIWCVGWTLSWLKD